MDETELDSIQKFMDFFRKSEEGLKIKQILKTIAACADFPVEDEKELAEIKDILNRLFPEEI